MMDKDNEQLAMNNEQGEGEEEKEKTGFFDKKKCKNCDTAEQERDECKAGWHRALADYQNLQRETERRLGEWTRMSEAQILGEFLPVYDHLKLAINNEQLTSDKNPWLEGVRHVARQFEGILKAHGIEEIKTVGEVFDASRHEAVGEEESEQPEHTIIRETEGGYTMGGKVLKVAKVIVAKGDKINE